jgi:hypothetical protein
MSGRRQPTQLEGRGRRSGETGEGQGAGVGQLTVAVEGLQDDWRRLLTDSEARGRQLSEIQFGPWGLFLGGWG